MIFKVYHLRRHKMFWKNSNWCKGSTIVLCVLFSFIVILVLVSVSYSNRKDSFSHYISYKAKKVISFCIQFPIFLLLPVNYWLVLWIGFYRIFSQKFQSKSHKIKKWHWDCFRGIRFRKKKHFQILQMVRGPTKHINY